MYPEGLRKNCFAGMYCDIAMESYFNAVKALEVIRENKYSSVHSACEYIEMNKNVVKTIVFSAMAIESFLNDYAAACLGDSEFYDKFDKLSTMSKLQLIAKFILKSEIDKKQSYYSYIKSLFKQRDSYVHNKSKQEHWEKYSSLEEFLNEFEQNAEEFKETDFTYNKEEIEEDYRSALNALKAVKELAIYFDENETTKRALGTMFSPLGLLCGSEKEKEYKKKVFDDLNITVDGNYRIQF